jgi:hypothetical protein
MIRSAACLILCSLAMVAPAQAAGKNDKSPVVSFHLEGHETDNPKMIFPRETKEGRKMFRRVPEISAGDVQAFVPFDTGSGTFGVLFQLKAGATRRLSAISGSNIGAWMLPQFNGRPMEGMVIDAQVDDGRIVIWDGVTQAEIALLDQKYPRIGQKKPAGKSGQRSED